MIKIVLDEALNLQQKKGELSSKLEKRAYKRFRMSADTSKKLRTAIFEGRVQAFEEELEVLTPPTGCRKQEPALTNQVIRDTLLAESQFDSDSIANTFNFHLVSEIKRISEADKAVTWQDYLLSVTEWRRNRDKFKVGQVSTWTVNRTRNFAQREFFRRNKGLLKGVGSAILRGPKPAKEKICQGWINRGFVSLKEALSVEWPPHLNCLHFWEAVRSPKVPFLRRRLNCPKLWVGG